MNISKSTVKNIFVLSLLPVISLFSFLFYVFWTYPVQILSQELAINNYFLFDSPYLQTSLLVCVILFILLILTSKFLPKVFPYILGLILVFLIGTFLYKLTSYDFGTFIDNNSLTTSKSILGYSSWYFALDGIIPIASIIITVFALKKDFYKPILLIFFLFYNISNIPTLINLKVQTIPTGSSRSITLSKNHKNVLLFMCDSVSPNILRENLTNLWTDDVKAWTKDFTFYDNVTSLTSEGTVGSLPSLIGGYEFTHQKQIEHFLKNTNTVISNSLYYLPSVYFYTELALKSIQKNNQKIPVTVKSEQIGEAIFNSGTNSIKLSSSQMINSPTPILSVSLYYFTPYLFKNNLAIDRDPKLSFGWAKSITTRVTQPARWIVHPPSTINIQAEDTSKSAFYYLEDSGLHTPFDHYANPPYSIYKASSTKDIENVFSDTLQHRMERLNTIIKILKDNDIYDNTRIIITSDHGTQHRPNGDLIVQYLKEISTDEEFLIYNDWVLPVFIMDKKFNTSQPAMNTDSRFLSTGDINNAILSSFDINSSNYIDYLSTMPPKRAFNVISIYWGLSHYLEGSRAENYTKTFNDYMKDISQQKLYKIRDIKTSDYDTIPLSNVKSLSDLTNIPNIEYLE